MGAGEKSARQDVDIEVMNLFVTFEVIQSMVNSLIIAFNKSIWAQCHLCIEDFFFQVGDFYDLGFFSSDQAFLFEAYLMLPVNNC